MKNFLSRAEADELCDSLVRPFCEGGGISRVDIDSFVKKALRCPVFYESFAEKDLDKIGFCGDGQTPLQVYRHGKPVAIVFPKEAIVLESYLLHEDEQGRRRFTLAHEAEHVLASRMCSSQAAGFHCPYDSSRVYNIGELRERLSIAEWQANTLAASLLMPRFLIKKELEKYTGGECLPVYGERVFRPKEKEILSEISRTMEVSYTALIIRLQTLGLLSHHPLSEYLFKELGVGGDFDADGHYI